MKYDDLIHLPLTRWQKSNLILYQKQIKTKQKLLLWKRMRGRKRRGTSHQQCIGYLQCFDRHKFMRTAIGFLSNQLFPCTNFLFVAKSLTPDTTLYHMWELHFRIQFTSFGRREKSKSPSNNCAHRYNLSWVSLFNSKFFCGIFVAVAVTFSNYVGNIPFSCLSACISFDLQCRRRGHSNVFEEAHQCDQWQIY